jgi:uncharacterized damage-inducible protein DinB
VSRSGQGDQSQKLGQLDQDAHMELGSNGSGALASGEIRDVVSDQSIRLASAYTLRESPSVSTRPSKSHVRLGISEIHKAGAYTFLLNDRLNQMLIERLDPAAWRAKPPSTVRTIAAIFTHVHNIRCKWIRLTAPHLKVPPQRNRLQCTPKQAGAALAKSAAGCAEMLEQALGGDSRIEKFHRDGWARPWPAGIEMLCYMLSHEAHHRGQVCMLAHQLGFPFSKEVTSDMWSWEKLSKQSGWPH